MRFIAAEKDEVRESIQETREEFERFLNAGHVIYEVMPEPRLIARTIDDIKDYEFPDIGPFSESDALLEEMRLLREEIQLLREELEGARRE